MSKNLSFPNTTYFAHGVRVGEPMLFNAAMTALSGVNYGLYMDSNHYLYWNNGVSQVRLDTTGGGGGVGSLDDAYGNGHTIVIDEGAITLTDATTGAGEMLKLTKSGAGSGNMIDIAVDAALTGN